MDPYLRATGRAPIADLCKKYAEFLVSDPEVAQDPEKYYDEVHEIDLDTLEPHIVGPHTPDLGREISTMSSEVDEKGYPEKLSAALIGSCTNSSYEDLTRSVSLVRQAKKAGLKVQSNFLVTPGSEQIYETIQRDGILQDFQDVGGTVLANACGPCIGQWKREDMKKGDKNSILTSYNRNFAKRNDGNPETLGFISSPELVVAMAFSGSMKFNPLTDSLKDKDGNDFKFSPPTGEVLPPNGYASKDSGYEAPTMSGEVVINPTSERLAFLEPFPKMDPVADYQDLPLLLKAKDKCTTDHISQAGPWLKFRGHLDNISNNMFLGATNFFTGEAGTGNHPVSGETGIELNKIARSLKDQGTGWVVVADENIGEGSSREHAAMEPRHMGGLAFIAKSYARIFEANLKKQGVLAFTFDNKDDYNKVQEKDRISFDGLDGLAPGKGVTATLKHADGSEDKLSVSHTLNDNEIKWFKAGSALNHVGQEKA
jgi:aconitate hydratase